MFLLAVENFVKLISVGIVLSQLDFSIQRLSQDFPYFSLIPLSLIMWLTDYLTFSFTNYTKQASLEKVMKGFAELFLFALKSSSRR